MEKMLNRKRKQEKEFISVFACKEMNMDEETKECKFLGLCIHQSIVHKGKRYCLRG